MNHAQFEGQKAPTFVYRISNAEEWKRAQEEGGLWGGQMDRDSGFIHLSSEEQVSERALGILKPLSISQEEISSTFED